MLEDFLVKLFSELFFEEFSTFAVGSLKNFCFFFAGPRSSSSQSSMSTSRDDKCAGCRFASFGFLLELRIKFGSDRGFKIFIAFLYSCRALPLISSSSSDFFNDSTLGDRLTRELVELDRLRRPLKVKFGFCVVTSIPTFLSSCSSLYFISL